MDSSRHLRGFYGPYETQFAIRDFPLMMTAP